MEQISRIQFYELAAMSQLKAYPNIFTVDILSRQGIVLARRVDTQEGKDSDLYFASEMGVEILSHLSN